MKAKSSCGFSLIELLIVIVILAILLAWGIPSFVDTLDKRRVTNATKALASQVHQARSFAILLNRPVTLEFGADANGGWCFGITDKAACSCGTAGSCQIEKPDNPGDRIEVVSRQAEYPNVSLAGLPASGRLVFEPTRGVRTDGQGAVLLRFSSSVVTTRTADVRVNAIGKALACSYSGGALGGLKQC